MNTVFILLLALLPTIALALPADVPVAPDLVASADQSGGGWEAPPPTSGWSVPAEKGWGWPKYKYLKFTIPIPILPRIKFGIKGGLKLNAAIQHPKGWGWRR